MKTIMATLMAILMVVTPNNSSAKENVPAPRSCSQNSGNARVCMACTVYYEARGETPTGQLAVGAVVMNRVKNKRYPSSVCGVVYQRGQFSWTPRLPSGKSNHKQWQASLNTADKILSGNYVDSSNGAMFFHSRQVRPSFAKTKKVVAVIGNHIFRR